MKVEVDDMFSALETHLESKGAPVIIGEWGTSTMNPSEDALAEFASYFVYKAKDCGMGTFYWMSLSDGMARSLPAFNMPVLAESIVRAYHGDVLGASYPSLEDFEYSYTVSYTTQWAELNLVPYSIPTSDYAAVRLVLGDEPGDGNLAVKMYGDSEDKQTYAHFSSKEFTFEIDESRLGTRVERITLQYMKTGTYVIDVKEVKLIGKDGNEETMPVSSFWGCSVEMDAVPKQAD